MKKNLFMSALMTVAAGSVLAASVHTETFESYEVGTTIANQGGWTTGEGDLSEIISRSDGNGGSKALELKTEGATLTNELDDASVANTAIGNGETVVFTSEIKFVPSDNADCGLQGGTDDTKFAIFAYADEANNATNLVVFHALDAEHHLYTNEVIDVNGALDDSEAYTKVTVKVFGTDFDGLFFTVALNDGEPLAHAANIYNDAELFGYDPTWFKTVEGSQTGDSDFSAICFKGTGAVDNLLVTTEASGGDDDLPDWFPTDDISGEADADADVIANYATWAAGQSDTDLTADDFSDQFLLNVSAAATPILKIDSVEVTAEGTQITVVIDGVQDASMEDVNGKLNILASNTLGSWDKYEADDATIDENGKAVIIVPASVGTFVKASVDYAAATDKLSDEK